MKAKMGVEARRAEKESVLSVMEELISDKQPDGLELENRWKKKCNAVFAFLARAASEFFVSRVKNEEITQIQSYIRRGFRKTGNIEKIKGDSSLQNVFLLGYCYGFDKMIDSFEAETSFRQNHSLKSVISSYKYVEPTLRILDSSFEIGHKELAEQLDISESALSNFMNKVQSYHLFNSTRAGKNKYYSLAYPNGEEALKIIKDDNRPSAAGYTAFLFNIMDSLKEISICDELGQDYVLKMCEESIWRYTTKPAECLKKLNDLALISKSERVYRNSLIMFEQNVKRKVTVFTKNIMSEQAFQNIIIKNLKKDIKYRWFITETEQFSSEEKIKDFFLKQWAAIGKRDNIEELMRNVHCHIIPKEKTASLFGDIYDAVIYDENEGFSCIGESISAGTPYIEMQQKTVEKFNQYEREQSECMNDLVTV